MKKISAIKAAVYLFLLAGILSTSIQAQEIIIGTSTTTTNNLLRTTYRTAHSQVIYLASEIGAPYIINGLALDLAQVPGSVMNNFTIRIKHTGLQQFPVTPSWDIINWTVVYQNNENIVNTGWKQFDFIRPFLYDGTQNILVDFSFSNSTSSGWDGFCKFSLRNYRAVYCAVNNNYGDPLTWVGTSPSAQRSTYVPNIKLIVSSVDTIMKPVFSVEGGLYNDEKSVVISCATPGAVIHYTTNGNEPTENDPVVESGSSVLLTSSCTLKAKAWAAGMEPSDTKSATYTLQSHSPSISVISGTYNTEQNVTLQCTTPSATIRYTIDGSDPDESSTVYDGNPITIEYSMTLKAKAWKGSIEPSLISSETYQLIVSKPQFSINYETLNEEQNIIITCDTPEATIHYTTNGQEPTQQDPVITSGSSVLVDHTLTLKAKAWKGLFEPSQVESCNYHLVTWHPYFNPNGGVFTSDPDVVITSQTPGALIHYTTDGSTPDQDDPYVLSGGIVKLHLGIGTTTLKARAFKENWEPSIIIQAFFRARQIIHVSSTGNDGSDGLSWETAKHSIEGAYSAAQAQDNIWVAAGTYAGGFAIRPMISLYGGFAGNETEFSQRNAKTNVTILGGGIHTDNYGDRPDRDTVIDGFTITGGSCDNGGGLFIANASPTISNNIITENTAIVSDLYSCNSGCYTDKFGCGGGIFIAEGSPLIMNNVITNNNAAFNPGYGLSGDFRGGNGGGIYYTGSGTASFVGNTIANNNANGANWDELTEFCHDVEICNPECHMEWICEPMMQPRNNPGLGGGIYLDGGAILTNNVISENKAKVNWGWGYSENSGYGGGMYINSGGIMMFGSVFKGNAAAEGGGLSVNGGSGTVTNCTFGGNVAYVGASIYSYIVWPYSYALYNNIIAFNSNGLYLYGGGTYSLLYNCIYDGISGNYNWGEGNITVDPQFVRAPDLNTGDYGDLRLSPTSPCIDAAYNGYVFVDTDDLDDDGNSNEPVPFDANGLNRLVDYPAVVNTGSGVPPIDMGAYELQSFIKGDLDSSNRIDFFDFTMFANFWAAGNCEAANQWCQARDFDQNGIVDLNDLSEIANYWLQEN